MSKLIKLPKRVLKINVVYCADNLEVMKQLPSESIDLIYIDPPFNTGTVRKSKAWGSEVQLGDFDDKWGGGINSYILWMANRLREMHRLLKPTGVLCVHLDYKSVHYIKVRLDEIFGQGSPDRGAKHLVNEVIWHYKTYQGQTTKSFPKKHDTILIYSKSKKYIFKLGYKNNYKETMNYNRWKKYINKNLQIIYGNHPKTDTRFSAYLRRWKANNNRNPEIGEVIYEQTGEVIDDVFDIQAIDPKNKNEKLGYPTQKPLALLERLLESFTNRDQIIADFFCGCGTTLSAAQSLGRKWIGVDVSKDASKVIRKRMTRDHQMKVEIVPLKSLTKAQILSLDPFECEKYLVRSIGGIPNDIQRGDGGIDGYLQEDGTPIQVKKSDNVGRPVIDSFHKHLQKNGKGIIIAKSFGRGAKEEVARLRLKEGYDVTLVTIDDILRDAA